MCFVCWEAAGRPSIINTRTKAAADLVVKLHEEHPGGGALHSQIDDMNLEDQYFRDGDLEETAGWLKRPIEPIERAVFDAFKALTEAERYSAVAIADGLITTGGAP